MFRLLKLAFYGFIGYALYQLYLGFKYGSELPQRPLSRDLEQAAQSGAGRMNITGTGRGATESTEEASGTSTPHRVGRGVVG